MEMLKFLPRRADEHVTHKESMIGAGADDANINSISLIPAGETINHVNAVSGVKIVNRTLSVDSPDLQASRLAKGDVMARDVGPMDNAGETIPASTEYPKSKSKNTLNM
jgi:hypothetical protein